MAASFNVTPELLRQLIDADPDTGSMTWKHRPLHFFSNFTPARQMANHAQWNKQYAGKPALNCISGGGYLHGGVLGTNVRAHRAIWMIFNGEIGGYDIDHINRVKTDNRLSNLRLCKDWQNQANTLGKTGKTSIYKGVCFAKGRWVASMKLRGKSLHIGYFEDEIDAAKAYDAVAKDLRGEFAVVNFDRNP